jgi:hypothetical protein
MTRRGRPLGLAILCVLLAGTAPAWAETDNPCPGADMALAEPTTGDPSVDYAPRLNLAALTRQARLGQRDGKTFVTYDLTSLQRLKDLENDIKALQKQDEHAKSQQRALAEAYRLVTRAQALHKAGQAASPEMGATLTHLNIVTEAYGYEFQQPIPTDTQMQDAVKLLADTVATGKTQAVNPTPDDSPFWTDPGKIGAKDLYKPVKGDAIDISKTVCTFTEAKGGWGTKGGFDIDCGKQAGEFKLKFGPETRTEPFNTRIYNALGFNVPTVEYTPNVTVKYERKILSQFNCRREIKAYISWKDYRLLRFPIHQYVNPFGFIKGARLKDGREIGMVELYTKLFNKAPPSPPWTDKTINKTDQPRPELENGNYQKSFEDTIDTLTWYAGSLEVKDKKADSIGAWDWNTPAYRDRREVRGAAVLSMWLGNYDLRWDNNKVKLVEFAKDKQRLALYLSDIGAGLGDATNIMLRNNDHPNEFAWYFTAGLDDRAQYTAGQNSMLKRIDDFNIAVTNFLPDFKNDAATAVTREDMLWMAKMIAELTEDQIKAALIAANFQSAEVYLLTEKLLNRREHLLRDAGGGGTVKPRLDQLTDYQPSPQQRMSAKLPDGRTVYAKTEDEKPGREKPVKLRVKNGKVEEYAN